MRTRKALINSSVNIISFFIAFIPNLIIRKVFLNSLGSEYLGLNSLYSNIIGWLSIAEMGIGTAIIFSLYKPYAKNDYSSMRAYINFYGKFYRSVGFIIMTIGIIMIPFLSFFIKGEVNLIVVYIGFLLYLINSVITYFFSHKLCILNVAQEGYILIIGMTISKLVISIVQIIVLKIFPNFISFIIIQLIINLLYYLAINEYVNKKYIWIKNGKEILEPKEMSGLLKNIKAMFIHKMASLVIMNTDNIIISKFLGLSVLAKYTNYQMVISAVQSVIAQGLSGITASIGNMLVDNKETKAYQVHKKLFFLNFWIVSFVTISLYNTLNQFVGLWFGNQYLLDKLTFRVILINLYFIAMRGSVEQFQSASGNYYQDRYAAIVESLINLIASLILVKYMGIAGVFIGTLLSNFTVVFWTKPYVVYKYVFDEKLINYFKMYFKYMFIGIITLIITNYITLPLKYNYNFKSFMINCIINIIIINGMYLIVFYKTDEFIYYKNIYKNFNKFSK